VPHHSGGPSVWIGAVTPESTDGQWKSLDRRTVLAFPFAQGGPAIVVILIAVVAGGRIEGLLIRLAATVGLLAIGGAVHLLRFRYRVADGRLETRSGLLGRDSKVINVDRIRGIEIEAKFAHRLMGVCALRIDHPGSGRGRRGDRIDAISHAEAARLREQLLHSRWPARDANADPLASDGLGQNPVTAGIDDATILTLPRKWLLFAPFSARLLLIGPSALLVGVNYLGDAGVRIEKVLRPGEDLRHWWPVGVVAIAFAIAIGSVLAAAVQYSGWTIRERGHDIVVTRGLLTRRVVAIERRRMRGTVLREPILGRAVHAAALQVVISGITGAVHSTLVPLGPRAALLDFGHRFVSRAPALQSHPRRALGRRLRRTLLPCAVLATATCVVAIAQHPTAALALGVATVVAGGLGLAWGVGLYRALGHAIDDQVLVSRLGWGVRRTETVQRDQPIGIRVRQSLLARRAGVATMEVALVARGHTTISDMAADEVVELAASLIPALGLPAGPHPPGVCN
jgi:putative membrane protein